MKKRFIIVGSGWRSLYYVRIAKALPDRFELSAMLCRTTEKAEKIAAEQSIYTTTSIEECINIQPDFVVVAVNKASIADVSKEWMNYGFTVLCETPATLDIDTLHELWQLHLQGKRLVVAEQYMYYPRYQAMLEVLKQNIIGEPDCINISLAHEYHGASLIRAFLQENVTTSFTVSAKTYEFPTVETLNRYEKITDGRVAMKKRTVATVEFDDGKVAWYDFDSEQYRSPIRKNFVKVQGRRGELINDEVYYLDKNNEPCYGRFEIAKRLVVTEETNPNLHTVCEVEKIFFNAKCIYEPAFGLCGLAEDETAMAIVMQQAADYEPEFAKNTLANALQDAYMAILMQKAVDTGEKIYSEREIWQID